MSWPHNHEHRNSELTATRTADPNTTSCGSCTPLPDSELGVRDVFSMDVQKKRQRSWPRTLLASSRGAHLVNLTRRSHTAQVQYVLLRQPSGSGTVRLCPQNRLGHDFRQVLLDLHTTSGDSTCCLLQQHWPQSVHSGGIMNLGGGVPVLSLCTEVTLPLGVAIQWHSQHGCSCIPDGVGRKKLCALSSGRKISQCVGLLSLILSKTGQESCSNSPHNSSQHLRSPV
eukprot:CAMPEP_0194509008 /NCGR_PEP_ID=MMETSP0253-20130528/39382_1 /TAXON_ID=2966 /ORGANISM="Noctiluca scintillans" /LENGTH=226 /DNA_ID=CAMNT_0039352091 /DNA_START=191 /DNA_END=872 /DNA_ORIENTATION=-